MAFERAVFDIVDAALGFAFVLRRAGAVAVAAMSADVGIEPVCSRDGGFEVVDIEDLRHAAEVAESIYQTA